MGVAGEEEGAVSFGMSLFWTGLVLMAWGGIVATAGDECGFGPVKFFGLSVFFAGFLVAPAGFVAWVWMVESLW